MGKVSEQEREGVTAMTNAQFSKTADFVAACDRAGIPATTRQASKWLLGRGLARLHRSVDDKGICSCGKQHD